MVEALTGLAAWCQSMEHQVQQLRAEVHRLKVELERTDPKLITTKEFCRRYGWTEGKLKSLLFHRHSNGLAAAVTQRGKGSAILINPELFFDVLKKGQKRRRRLR